MGEEGVELVRGTMEAINKLDQLGSLSEDEGSEEEEEGDEDDDVSTIIIGNIINVHYIMYSQILYVLCVCYSMKTLMMMMKERKYQDWRYRERLSHHAQKQRWVWLIIQVIIQTTASVQ